MDSITQIVLGAAIAGAIAPRQHRRAALLAGAALGTLPDLDSLPLALLTDNPVDLMTLHRSASHSLFVLPLVGALLWWLFKRRGGRVAQAPARWFWAIQLALITHPLLDGFTVYGTQLWWPLQPHPAMWSSVFIIDPAYTLGLLLACVVAWWLPQSPRAQQALLAGLLVSSGYLGWSLWAKHLVDAQADRDLAALGLAQAPRFSVPTPFNTLLWKVVAMTPQGYVIGERSLVADHGPMHFRGYPSNTQALAEVSGYPAVRQLRWFNRGFMRAQVDDGQLVLSDLRMGIEPDYNFSFVVAEGRDGQWRAVTPRQPQSGYRAPVAEGDIGKALAGMWQRIWHQPPPPRAVPLAADQAAAATSGITPAISASK
ncbi:metal-dependent hydrolase [Pseudoxanthomonas dokdonensis]|uniref:Membrane protein n=1 Tax=Pseudoxanthomonas dokdonensis TaxID=344882 RepID=A0A0R0CKP7_9GAMM|nr:metal-dependent hydrolase [Pseudoxanthomonas dokdonensis]KRG70112.1 membrane protein [Pseudoxanthomonas dokdonensis]